MLNDKLGKNSDRKNNDQRMKDTTSRLRVLSTAISEIKKYIDNSGVSLEDIASLVGVKLLQVKAFVNNNQSSLVPRKISALYDLLVPCDDINLKKLIDESSKNWFERLNYLFKLDTNQIEIFCGIRDFYIQKASLKMEWKKFVKTIPHYTKFISLTKKGGKTFDSILENKQLWDEWQLFLKSKTNVSDFPEVGNVGNKIIISLKKKAVSKDMPKVVKNKAAPATTNNIKDSDKISNDDFDVGHFSLLERGESTDDLIIKALIISSQRTRALNSLIISSIKSSSPIVIPKELSDELNLLYINLQALAKEYPDLPYNQIVELYNELKSQIGLIAPKNRRG
jgi:hypothetical protein